MRVGGGKDKGSAWERQVGKLLSLWLTNAERGDIFSRNVLSGGAFTLAEAAGKISSRAPGDLMAAHPLAFNFLSRFSVECKHLANIGLEAYLLDPRAQTSLGQIISLASRQAKHIKLEYMIVAKQNNREAIVMIDGDVGEKMMRCLRAKRGRISLSPMHHYLHRGSICMLRFCDMLSFIDPEKLLEGLGP
jgi:hypothetical protein